MITMLNENETTFYCYSLSITILEYYDFMNDINILAASVPQLHNRHTHTHILHGDTIDADIRDVL